MRAVPIPDDVAQRMPGRRVVVGPPNQDLDSGIPPVEAMHSVLTTHGAPTAVLSVRCVLEANDLERLVAGEHVWVTFLGHMVPFDVAVGP